jgi:hypothetical protein
MNVPVSSLRIVRVVVARVGSGVVEVGGVTGVIGEAAIGGILADGESHAAAMTSKTNRAVKRRITPTPFVTVEFAKSRRGGDENLAMLHLARGSGQRSTECDVRGGWVLSDADPLQVFTYMTVSGSMLCRRSLGVRRVRARAVLEAAAPLHGPADVREVRLFDHRRDEEGEVRLLPLHQLPWRVRQQRHTTGGSRCPTRGRDQANQISSEIADDIVKVIRSSGQDAERDRSNALRQLRSASSRDRRKTGSRVRRLPRRQNLRRLLGPEIEGVGGGVGSGR